MNNKETVSKEELFDVLCRNCGCVRKARRTPEHPFENAITKVYQCTVCNLVITLKGAR